MFFPALAKIQTFMSERRHRCLGRRHSRLSATRSCLDETRSCLSARHRRLAASRSRLDGSHSCLGARHGRLKEGHEYRAGPSHALVQCGGHRPRWPGIRLAESQGLGGPGPPGAVATTLNLGPARRWLDAGHRSAGILPAGGAAFCRPARGGGWKPPLQPPGRRRSVVIRQTFSTIFFANSLDLTFVAPCIWRSRS